jgi:large subunit ribosomal protein L15
MMGNNVRKPAGARKAGGRIGRGDGSGRGSYSGKGMKGQKARSGRKPKLGMEGGNLPLHKKLPTMRGFTNLFGTKYIPVNVGGLNKFPEGSEVTLEKLIKVGLVKNAHTPVKILGEGEVSKPLTVHAHRFSAEARKKIEAAGGKVKEL